MIKLSSLNCLEQEHLAMRLKPLGSVVRKTFIFEGSSYSTSPVLPGDAYLCLACAKQKTCFLRNMSNLSTLRMRNKRTDYFFNHRWLRKVCDITGQFALSENMTFPPRIAVCASLLIIFTMSKTVDHVDHSRHFFRKKTTQTEQRGRSAK